MNKLTAELFNVTFPDWKVELNDEVWILYKLITRNSQIIKVKESSFPFHAHNPSVPPIFVTRALKN